MSSQESDIAKAIREQTAYFKSITDTIKVILLVGIITIIALYGLIIAYGVIVNYLNHDHELTPAPTAVQQSQIESGYNASKKIDAYHEWCMKNYQSWVRQSIDTLPYCTNQYGEKIHP